MTVKHRLGEYPVSFGSLSGALKSCPDDAVVLTDSNVNRHWGALALERWPVHAVTPGEGSKSIATYQTCLQWLAETGASRRTVVIALGGGVVGDLAGFVAATYMRGIPLIQIPTTLLSMVDSSVGGKVGIDLPHGKNLVGAFYPPTAAHVCLETLSTLAEREFSNGMAEVVKYGFILDESILQNIEGGHVESSSAGLEALISRCIELKARVVEEDELETKGRRAILNFGHTVGHALEKATGYGPLLHGEAISIGMVVETALGESLGITQTGMISRVREHLLRQRLPITHAALMHTDELIQTMRSDKKATSGNLAFSLVTEPGACKLVENVPPGAVEAALRAC
ncbi:MAG: 3-dehydroquinate synthase [Fimbriimonadaceae bacterium]